MAFDIVPRSLWNLSFPRFDDDDFVFPNVPGGLSISEDEKNVYVEAAVPGIEPDDVEITYDKGMLWIKGESKKEEERKKYYRRATNSFSYRVAVPGDIDQNVEPEAEYKNGIMTVAFAKSPKTEPKRIAVKKATLKAK